jgi:hypothetical protein
MCANHPYNDRELPHMQGWISVAKVLQAKVTSGEAEKHHVEKNWDRPGGRSQTFLAELLCSLALRYGYC